MARRRSFWKVVSQIEALIDSGGFSAGSRLPAERELAERFDVSRPTVREAIIALEVKGRVEVRSNAGVFVSQDVEKIDTAGTISAFELTQARALVEGESAALAAVSIKPAELEALKQCLDDMAKGNDSEAADKKFHFGIAKATSNGAIVKIIDYLWEIRENQPNIRAAYEMVCSGSHSQRQDEHTQIYKALSKGDSEGARRAMHNHFNRLINALFDFTEQQALEEIKRKSEENRGRFSLNQIYKGSRP